MSWFIGIICVIAFGGLMCCILWDPCERSIGVIFGAIFLSLAGTFVGFIITLLILSGVYSCVEDNLAITPISSNSTEIVALKDTKNTYISRSYQNDEFIYVYMINTPQGKQMQTVDAEDCYIMDVPVGEYPTIVKHECKYDSAVARFFFGSASPYYTIYLPESAIIDALTYEIDLE